MRAGKDQNVAAFGAQRRHDPVGARPGFRDAFAAGAAILEYRPARPLRLDLRRRQPLVDAIVPLGEVIDDLQRYLPARIFLLDGALDRITVTGVFEATRAEAALQTIADTMPIRLVRVTDLLVFVTAAG